MINELPTLAVNFIYRFEFETGVTFDVEPDEIVCCDTKGDFISPSHEKQTDCVFWTEPESKLAVFAKANDISNLKGKIILVRSFDKSITPVSLPFTLCNLIAYKDLPKIADDENNFTNKVGIKAKLEIPEVINET